MPGNNPPDRAIATEMLVDSMNGSARSASKLLPLVYEELRARAERHIGRENPGHTLQATALVHEAYVRLIDGERVDWQGRTHFLAVAATTMRRVLVDHARARATERRGGGRQVVSLSGIAITTDAQPLDVMDLDAALEKLAETKPRHAQLIELRFFGGLSVEEAAQELGISKATAKSDWRFARVWVNRELSKGDRS